MEEEKDNRKDQINKNDGKSSSDEKLERLNSKQNTQSLSNHQEQYKEKKPKKRFPPNIKEKE